jgi:hypothetical protein
MTLLHGLKGLLTTPKKNLNEEKVDKELSTVALRKGVNRRAARWKHEVHMCYWPSTSERLSADASARIVFNTVVLGNEIKAGRNEFLQDRRVTRWMPGKRVHSDDETGQAADLLARDRRMAFELAEEAFRDLLR